MLIHPHSIQQNYLQYTVPSNFYFFVLFVTWLIIYEYYLDHTQGHEYFATNVKSWLIKKKKTIVNQKRALLTTQNGAISFIFHNYSLAITFLEVRNLLVMTAYSLKRRLRVMILVTLCNVLNEGSKIRKKSNERKESRVSSWP